MSRPNKKTAIICAGYKKLGYPYSDFRGCWVSGSLCK